MTPASPADSDRLLPLPRSFHRVLVIAAHPDDAEFAFGATVARLTGEGAQVTYLVVTDGAQGGEDPTVPAPELTATRYAEQRDAARMLGVTDVVFLGLPDGLLTDTPALRLALTRQIRRHRPELVLTHQPLRSLQFPIGASHPDHLAVGQAALNAVYPDARNPRAFPELLAEDLPAHRVAEVWVPGHEHTDLLVDVGETAELKVSAILAHRSQFRSSPDPRADVQWVVDRMRGNGTAIGCEYAEAYKRIVTDAAGAAGPTPTARRPTTEVPTRTP
ncbi:PIG-L deacetylase family protein [Micromonospora antibiotica]|uniref:PIG-L family deacetylase n=1 Tax=Micromonospora antibiotica TaxID=2807623 RepID=A0ABS3VCF9_9ACTN|nr:PIG-L deacetylase family protein [Micromonospora antibiotica]MBO4163275.1 PIG-L family deacetylase [Micromonospora antibiotica]